MICKVSESMHTKAESAKSDHKSTIFGVTPKNSDCLELTLCVFRYKPATCCDLVSAPQIHHPKAIIEFRFPKAASRHWVQPTHFWRSRFSKAVSQANPDFEIGGLQSRRWQPQPSGHYRSVTMSA